MGLLKLKIKWQTKNKYCKVKTVIKQLVENKAKEDSDFSPQNAGRKGKRKGKGRGNSLVFSICADSVNLRRAENRQEQIIFLFPFHSSLSSQLERFILHPLLRLTEFQFLGTSNEFNMTSSYQNSNIFCCGVRFS